MGSVGGPVEATAFGHKPPLKIGQAERAPVWDRDHGGLRAFTII
jgi:hypothetical protein